MRRLSSLVVLTAALAACNNSHVGEPDSAIVFDLDGAMLDGGVDAPVPDSVIGDVCSGDAECGESGICLSDPDLLPGGYCSQACAADLPCPDGATCLTVGMGQSFCFLDCDPEATTRSCAREGYGCASNFMVFPSPVCVGGCSDDTDCGGLSCDVGGGFYGAGTCFDPGSMVGDACTADTDCPSGGACISEAGSGWPSGSCATGCDFATNAGCETGSCINGGFGGGLCTTSCTTDGDCRDGYACRPVAGAPSRMYCAPACASDAECTVVGNVCNVGAGTCDVPFDAGNLGGTCRRSGMGCEGGSCLSEFTTGFPSSYCAYVGCTLGGTDCPGDGVCTAGAAGANFCLDGCTTGADCRAGYACRPSNAAEPTSATACVPACVDDSVCNTARGFSCNAGIGRCTVAFEAARQGEPCADASECPGGRCHDEATDGWPAGTCVSIGCRLAGSGPGVDCNPGNVCVDDGTGDPEIGECLPACTVGMPGCRPGYACAALEGGTEGVCRPDCDATSCDASRACDDASGLCR